MIYIPTHKIIMHFAETLLATLILAINLCIVQFIGVRNVKYSHIATAFISFLSTMLLIREINAKDAMVEDYCRRMSESIKSSHKSDTISDDSSDDNDA